MFTKYSGGRSGIKEYFESGRKTGREMSRDEMDERIVLVGDLDVTHALIESMDTEGEKYIHITHAFKEDYVSPEILHAVVDKYRELAMSAYNQDEYCLYAEAHIPKIKSYSGEADGQDIERKPHIHMVIVKRNLLSGQHLNPFGMVEKVERHMDAIQESINNEFGFASPKENRRIEFTGASEMISRHKGDIFNGNNRALKGEILETILSKNIESYDAFKTVLARHGVTKPRNGGKDNEYQTVKPPGGKGVNLTEFVFSREFIELPTAAKQQRLAAEVQRKYEVAGDPRRDSVHIAKQLDEWRTRAKEIKYLNSGNKKQYQEYRKASPEDRQQMLADLEKRFYTQHRKANTHEQENRSRTDRAAGIDRYHREYGFKQSPGAERAAGHDRVTDNRQFDPKPFGQGTPPQSLNSVRTLSSVGVVSFAKGSEVLLPDHARHQLEHQRTERADGLRRPADRAARLNPATGREADSAIDQRSRDLRESQLARSAGRQSDVQEAKQKLDAGRLLAELSRTHGLIPEKYEVTKAKDGSDRIKCGTRNLNVSDFLTKEMNMPWKEAAQTLRASYSNQLGREAKLEPRQQPRQQLWAEFQEHRKGKAQQQQRQRTTQVDSQRNNERERREAIKKEFYAKRSKAQGDCGASAAQRKAAVSVARMERLLKESALRDRIKVEREQLKIRKPATEQYRDFLTDKAQAGDERALSELRRMSPASTEKARDADALVTAAEPAREKQESEPIYRARAITYHVERNGDVTYQREGRDMLRDQGKAVHMLQSDHQTIETGLRLAQQKFGNKLALSGPQDFQEKAARIAAESGLKVEFTDQRLNKIMRDRTTQLEEQKAANIEAARAGKAFATEREREQKGNGRGEALERPQGPLKGQEGPAVAATVPPQYKPPYKDGRTTGPIVAVDQNHVYQRHGQDNVRHDRKDFNEALKPGDVVQVQYHQGRATVKQVQEQAKGQSLDDSKNQDQLGL